MAAYQIRDVFNGCGVSTKLTIMWLLRGSKFGTENLLVFARLAFEFVVPDLGSDPGARKVLRRRLKETEKTKWSINTIECPLSNFASPLGTLKKRID